MVAESLKKLREARGLTGEGLARLCAENGAPEITRAVIANIETGRPGKEGRRRREVTVDELLVFAYVLDVPPVLLMVPLDAANRLQITANVDMDVLTAASWATGDDGVTGLYRNEALLPANGRRRQNAIPLALLLRIAAALRRAGRVQAGEPGEASPALINIGQDIAQARDWLASLDLTPPDMPVDIADAMQRGSAAIGSAEYPQDAHPGEDA